MTSWQLLSASWHWHPSVLLGCALLLGGYAALWGGRLGARAGYAIAGALVLLLALVSPIHTLGETYLFSAHMLQHLLLMLAVPPLLLAGLPEASRQSALTPAPADYRLPATGWAEAALRGAMPTWPVAWALGIGTMWLWHAPPLYNAALAHQGVHIAEHLTMLAASVAFWWPVAGPPAKRRLAPLAAVAYLFAAMLASGVLGIILTFAAPGLYPAYLEPQGDPRMLALLREGWGLIPAEDQQLGGLLMWVPGGLVYLAAMLGALARWYGAADAAPWPAPLSGEGEQGL